MAKNISSLNVILNATVAPFVSGFASLKSTIGGFTSSLGSASSTLLKFTGIGAAIGAMAGGAGLGLLVHDQLEAIDAAAKLSDRLGVTTESLTGLEHAASLAHVSNEQLTGGLDKMLKNLGQAAEGSKTATAAFANLGLNAKDLANLPTDQALGQIADKLARIDNPSQRAAAAVGIFGKSAGELLPLLMRGSEGISQATADAQALGLSFNRIDGAAVERANESVSRLGDALTGIVRQATIAFAPFIESAANAATAFGVKLVAGVKEYLPPVVAVFGAIFNGISSVFDAIYAYVAPIVSGIFDFITTNFLGILTSAVQIWDGVSTAVKTSLNAVWGIVSSVWATAMGFFGVSTGNAGATATTIFQGIVNVVEWLAGVVQTAFLVASYAISHWKETLELVGASVALFTVRTGNQITYVFTDVIPGILKWFANNWRQIFTDMFNFTTTVLGNLMANVYEVFANLPGLIKGTVKFNDIWTPLTQGFEATLSELPKIAQRHSGPLEDALQANVDNLKKAYGDDLNNYISQHMQKVVTDVNGITNAIKPPVIPPPVIKPPVIPPIDTSNIEKVTKKAKEAKDALNFVTSGSAESQKAIYEASHQLPTTAAEAESAPLDHGTHNALKDDSEKTADLTQKMVDLMTYISVNLERFRKQEQDSSGNIAIATFGG